MAVQFPDPIDNPVFVAPNGVTYRWDENDYIWRAESGISGADYILSEGDTMNGDLNFSGTNKVITRHIDSGQNSNLELKHNGTTRIFVGGSTVSINNSTIVKNGSAEIDDSIFCVEGNQAPDGNGDKVLNVVKKGVDGDQLRYYGPVTFNKEVATKEYVDNSIPTVYLPTSIQLGQYTYKRTQDNWQNGCIRSNTTTDPASIFRIELHHENRDGIDFTKAFLDEAVREKMFLTIYGGENDYYLGKITGVDKSDNKGVILTMTYVTSAGSFYFQSAYWVSISMNKHDNPIN